MARHGPMVLGVCRGARPLHDAEDAFQATFLVLAPGRRGPGARAPWRAGSTGSHGGSPCEPSRGGPTESVRARGRGEEGGGTRGPAGSPEDWPELHEAIARLPERYREPVVLHYLEGLTTEEAAARIGCPEGTIHSRLSRARERLRGKLERRGLMSTPALLTTRLAPRAMELLPARLLNTTVRAAFGFAGRHSGEAGPATASATTLAKGVLHTMTISKLMKILGVTALASGLAWGGAHFRAVGRPRRRRAAYRRAAGRAEPFGGQAPIRPRRVGPAERRDAQGVARHSCRDGGTASRKESSVATKAAVRVAEAINEDRQSGKPARRSAQRHPAGLSGAHGYSSQVYILDLVEGGITRIANEPAPDLTCCGRPTWSHDGRRILFEAAGGRWPRARIWAIEVHNGRPTYTVLGDGNDPTLSPDDKRIAFLLHASNEAGAGGGLWMMRADGSGRHRVGDFGSPSWSPDGREFLINSYSLPTNPP